MIEIQDVIQITDETHPWFGALLIVDEVHAWGVQAYAPIPENNKVPKSCSAAYNRLKHDQYERIGVSVIGTGPTSTPTSS